MNRFASLFVLGLTVAHFASAATWTCKFQKKDPQGTIEDTMVLGFDYTLLGDGQRVLLKNFNLGKAEGYAREGAVFPSAAFGDLNPDYGSSHDVATRHQGYQQFKNFKKVEADVLFSHFELLLKDGSARLLLTTNDGVHTEELFSCSK